MSTASLFARLDGPALPPEADDAPESPGSSAFTAMEGVGPRVIHRRLIGDVTAMMRVTQALAERAQSEQGRLTRRRAQVLAAHLGDVCAMVRDVLHTERRSVMPVLRHASLGYRLAAVRATCTLVEAPLADVERGAAALSDAGDEQGLAQLADALRATRRALLLHSQLWGSHAEPLARELLSARAGQGHVAPSR